MRPTVEPTALTDIAQRWALQLVGNDVAVTGISHDSRTVRPNDLYAALPGDATHGAAHAEQAIELGAAAVLTDPTGLKRLPASVRAVPTLVAEEPRKTLGPISAYVYGNPSQAISVVAITGTDGKTTTAMLVQAALSECGIPTGLLGTVGNRFGSLTFPGVRTTPEAPDLHAMLAIMREQGASAVVMEASSHALALHRVDGVAVDVAVFTNLSHDHLDFHGDMDNYYAAKARLFTASMSQSAVICVDDKWGERLAAECTIPHVTYGLVRESADWRVANLRRSPAGSGFRVLGPDMSLDAGCRLPGDFNVANAVAAIVASHSVAGSWNCVVRGVAASEGVPGRMQLVPAGDATEDIAVFVDYAHTPEAVERTIAVGRTLANERNGRVLVAIGCGGDRDHAKRPEMGAVAARLADVVVVTDDNPRSEDPSQIRATVLAAANAEAESGGATVLEIGDRAQALRYLVEQAADNDVVLALGKGHEKTQEIAGELYPFDDVAVLEAAMRESQS